MQDRQAVIEALATTAQAATILLHRTLTGDVDVIDPDEYEALTLDLRAASDALDAHANQEALRGHLRAV